MKKPTAMELWNLRIIIVPPMQSPTSITPDQNAANPSANKRDPRTRKLTKESINDKTRIEYLQLTGEIESNAVTIYNLLGRKPLCGLFTKTHCRMVVRRCCCCYGRPRFTVNHALKLAAIPSVRLTYLEEYRDLMYGLFFW
jgi:hypothetical protein